MISYVGVSESEMSDGFTFCLHGINLELFEMLPVV